MNIGLLNILHNKVWDFRPDMAQSYANALKNAIELHIGNDIEKQHGYFLSRKGTKSAAGNFEDKLYVGNIHRIERHLYWNDEELQEDDQIVNVVVVDGPVTRDGDGCSYGTKDFRDQVMYANTIPQVVGHLFLINTPGGQASCRNDYDMMIEDCRRNGKPTVAFVDGMCCSSGVNLACRCDRVIVMNPRDEFGCIGTMAAFWAVAHDTISQDGFRYVELVGKDCPEKNDWYREAAKGEYEKLQAELDRDTEEFHRTVRENRPLVTDDMLTGRVFEAQEVIPALVDEVGNMERAIECVFQLADETLTAARLVTAEPKEEEDHDEGGDGPEELARLNGQQKAAADGSLRWSGMPSSDSWTLSATDRDGMSGGTHEEEVANPKNENNMPNEEEKKAQEAQEAQAAQEQAQGQEAEEQEAQEEQNAGQQEAQEQEAGQQEAQEQEAEEQEAQEEQNADQQEAQGQEAGQQEVQEQDSAESLQDAQAEIERIQETLHNAERMVADRDKEIEALKLQIDQQSASQLDAIRERDAAVKERNDISASLEKAGLDYAEQGNALSDAKEKIAEYVATIEKLTRQVADLRAEVKELAGKPEPMTDGAAGVPEDNGTGDAPKPRQKRVTRGMTYEQIREATKKQDKK